MYLCGTEECEAKQRRMRVINFAKQCCAKVD